MKTLTELAQENGALGGYYDLEQRENLPIVFESEYQLQATFEAYCKQLSEPIYQVLGASGAWYDLEESQYNRFNIFKYRIIYLAPQPTTEDVNCINRLVNVLNDSEVVLASQPQSLKN